jgi:electron transport complex protein RnfE
LFIPLIVVNCIVLGRAEAFASKNNVFASLIDGLAMGLGFAFALTLLGGLREILGGIAIFDWKIFEGIAQLFNPATNYKQPDGILVFVLAPGAFFGLGAMPDDPAAVAPAHNPHFFMNEEALITGMEMMINIVFEANK